MVVDGGIIDVMQPIQMADTTGVDTTAGTWQNMAQMTVWCGWIGRVPGTQWRRCLWKSGPSSQNNDLLNIDFYSSISNNIFVYYVIGIFFHTLDPSKTIKKLRVWLYKKLFTMIDIKNSTQFSFISFIYVAHQEVTRRIIVNSLIRKRNFLSLL